MSEPQRILVRAPNWTGDLVMATPGFRALRAGRPDAHLVLHVRPALAALLAGAPWFDEVLPLASYGRGTAALVREALDLRRRRIDVGLCLPDSFSSALLLRLGGACCVVGHRSQGRGLLLHHAIVPPIGLVSREKHVLGLVEALGCAPRGTHLELFTTAAEEAEAGRLLAEARVGAADALVLLAPGSSYGPAKHWHPESFARVGDALAADGIRVALVGAPGEAALAQRVAAAMRSSVVDWTGRLDLGGLKAVLRRAQLLVCNDAGARHVAVAFGVPVIALFGPTSLAKTSSNLEQVTPLAAPDVACRPCYRRTCPIDHRCMTRIPPERVVEIARSVLRARPVGSAA